MQPFGFLVSSRLNFACASSSHYVLFQVPTPTMRSARDEPAGSSPAARTRSTKLFELFGAEPVESHSDEELSAAAGSADTSPAYNSDWNMTSGAGEASPYSMSPLNPAFASPLASSPWTHLPLLYDDAGDPFATGLVGSLVRREGHVYSLAASGDLLYTGSESKNIRVWKGRSEFAGFKSSSGLVKAIVVAGDKIFTGHQDGKIRIWKTSSKDPSTYKRAGTLPRLRDYLKSSVNPSNYVEVRPHRNAVWLRHFDAVSCLSLDEDADLLYSGSWDRTVKVWRISDSKCMESIKAHDDAVNSVAVGFGGFLFTGSADGVVKVWRREIVAKGATRHVLVQTILRQESAVTALAVVEDPAEAGAGVVYSGSSDGRVNHWRWAKGRMPVHGGVLLGHAMAVLCLAAAGRVVVSGSADKTLCVWRREEAGDHWRMAVLAGHEGPIKCLAVEEDSQVPGVHRGGGGGGFAAARYVVYSGSLDKSVKIWRVTDSEMVTEKTTPRPMPTNTGDMLQRSPSFNARGGDVAVSEACVSNLRTRGKLIGFGSPVNQGLTEQPANVLAAA